jgi:hypothetical protein
MDTARVIRLLEPRAPWVSGSGIPFERGMTGTDHRIHALHKTLTGDRAICDESMVLIRLGGRFDHDHLDSCLACVDLTTQ